ncbi:DgyrCDS10490 [Dimorphilus gyrociliatus]|uniref:DgyrCDS10490 n=1 Tax=Dimorphilus gyrociliatus TaxID=2664684 RepID=A0A7I8W1J3_9ANNE|nr:DgyrCDS10490 [Dimorphilus gyrociliatus]
MEEQRSKTAWRSTKKAPEFKKRLSSSEEVKEGQTVVFSCSISALPSPRINWYKDEESLSGRAGYFTSEEDDGTTQNLVIRNASKNHEGTYKCVAENTEGVATSTAPSKRVLSSKSRDVRNPDHVISLPPNLHAISEHYSMEQELQDNNSVNNSNKEMEMFANDFSEAIWNDVEDTVVSRADEKSKDNELSPELSKLTQDPCGSREDNNDQEKFSNEALFEELIKQESKSSLVQDKTHSSTPSEGDSTETDWQKEEIPCDFQQEGAVKNTQEDIIPQKQHTDENELLETREEIEEKTSEFTTKLLLEAAKDEWKEGENLLAEKKDSVNLKEIAKNIVIDVISSSQKEISKKPITQSVWSAEFQKQLREKIFSVPAILFLTLIFVAGVLGSIFEIGILPFAFCVTVAFLSILFSYQFFTNCDN